MPNEKTPAPVRPARTLSTIGLIASLFLIATGGAIILRQSGRIGAGRHLPATASGRSRADAPTGLDQEGPRPAPRTPVDAAPPPSVRPVAAEHTPWLNSKEGAQLRLRVGEARLRETMAGIFGPLIKRLGLDPEAARQFEELAGKERLAAADAVIAARAQGVQSPQDYVMVVQAAIAELDQQIQDLLGPEGFGEFQNYRQTLPEQQTVAKLAERLSSSPAPLTDGQQLQLVQVLNEMELPGFRQNETFMASVGVAEVPLTKAMVAASSQILSGPQLSAFQAMQENFHRRVQIVQMLLAQGAK